MKKLNTICLIISHIAMFTLFVGTVSAGVWAPQGSSSGGGSEDHCYILSFEAGNFGVRYMVGTGVILNGTFTGFMWWPGTDGKLPYDCGSGMAAGACAYQQAKQNSSSVSVKSLPFYTAAATGCY